MNTFRVNLIGYILAIVVALIVGIKAAVDRRSLFDQFLDCILININIGFNDIFVINLGGPSQWVTYYHASCL